MNSNVGVQHQAVVAWTGAAAIARDLRRHARFGFVFEVTGAIAVDAVFGFEAAPASDADNCAPGAFADVEEIAICNWNNPNLDLGRATVTIPAGTPVGTICAGTLPCKPDAFIRPEVISGTTANVRIVLVLDGPMV